MLIILCTYDYVNIVCRIKVETKGLVGVGVVKIMVDEDEAMTRAEVGEIPVPLSPQLLAADVTGRTPWDVVGMILWDVDVAGMIPWDVDVAEMITWVVVEMTLWVVAEMTPWGVGVGVAGRTAHPLAEIKAIVLAEVEVMGQ